MKKDKYLDKAITLFKKEGVSMPIEVIAEKMGVSKKTLYNNFESKDGLIEQCMESVLNDLVEKMECFTDENIAPEECFIAGINVLRLFFKESSPFFLKDMLTLYPNLTSNEHTTGYELFVEKLQSHIARGQKKAVYRNDIDSNLMARYISYSIFGYYKNYVMTEGQYTTDHYFNQVINYNLKALKY